MVIVVVATARAASAVRVVRAVEIAAPKVPTAHAVVGDTTAKRAVPTAHRPQMVLRTTARHQADPIATAWPVMVTVLTVALVPMAARRAPAFRLSGCSSDSTRITTAN